MSLSIHFPADLNFPPLEVNSNFESLKLTISLAVSLKLWIFESLNLMRLALTFKRDRFSYHKEFRSTIQRIHDPSTIYRRMHYPCSVGPRALSMNFIPNGEYSRRGAMVNHGGSRTTRLLPERVHYLASVYHLIHTVANLARSRSNREVECAQ